MLHIPGGQRVIIEICCNNMSYEAQNLRREQQIDGVDKVLAVTPNQKTRKALEQSVEKCTVADEATARLRPLIVVDAGECLKRGFDWAVILKGPAEP